MAVFINNYIQVKWNASKDETFDQFSGNLNVCVFDHSHDSIRISETLALKYC